MRASTLAQEIKSKIKISSVIKRTVDLKGRGTSFLGLCPFHQEKTPSFHVRDQEGRFKCFGCGATGDVFEFLKLLRGLSFQEAIEVLAQDIGLSAYGRKSATISRADPQSELLRAQKVAHQFFIRELHSAAGEAARNYLIETRKLSLKMIQEAQIGFLSTDPRSFYAHLKSNRIGKNLAEKVGLIKHAQGGVVPQFAGRIIFPIKNRDGQVIAFGARSFMDANDSSPKYVNTHKYEFYEKRKSLYGIFESKAAINKGLTPIMVEGYFDALAMWACGFPAVALCGTALSAEHARIVKSMAKTIIFCADADEAGEKSLIASLPHFFSVGLNTRMVQLKKNDPAVYFEEGALNDLKADVSSHEDALTHVIRRLSVKAGRDIEQRLWVIDQLTPIFLSIERAVLRRQYVALLASCLHDDPSVLWQELERQKKRHKRKILDSAISAKINLSAHDRLAWQILLSDPSLAEKIASDVADTLSPPMADLAKKVAQEKSPLSPKHGDYVLQVARSISPGLESALRSLEIDGLLLSTSEASEMLNGIIEKAKKNKDLDQLRSRRAQLVDFEKKRDFSAVVKSLAEQSQFLAARKKKNMAQALEIAAKKPPKPNNVSFQERSAVPKSTPVILSDENPIFESDDDWF